MRCLLVALCACSSPTERGPPPFVQAPVIEPPAVEPPAEPHVMDAPPIEPAAQVEPPPLDALVGVDDAFLPVPDGDRLWVFEDGIYEEQSGRRTSVAALTRGALEASDAAQGADALLVPGLERALAARSRRSRRLVLGVAPQIPARTLNRVIYTATQNWDGTGYYFLLRHGDELTALHVEIPRPEPEPVLLGALGDDGAFDGVLAGEPAAAAIEPAPANLRARNSSLLRLSITVTRDGLIVAGSGGTLRPGCRATRTRRVLTVPVRDGAQDWAELRVCLARVKARFRRANTVAISADPDIPFHDVVSAMVSAHGSIARPLFRGISFGVR